MMEEEPRPKRKGLEQPQLDPLGIDDLRAYIGELRTEISRVEAEIARKQAHRSAADAFFKLP